MAERKWVFILAVSCFFLGLIVNEYAASRACPKPSCVDSARVIPVTDRGYHKEALKIIRGAEESIHIASFELKYYEKYPDSSMNEIIMELVKAYERGVDVQIVVDEYSSENNAYHILDEYGIPWRFDGKSVTTHSKLIIIDGRIVLLGSTNLSYYGLEKNNEANILVMDEKTGKYYEEYFQELWRN